MTVPEEKIVIVDEVNDVVTYDTIVRDTVDRKEVELAKQEIETLKAEIAERQEKIANLEIKIQKAEEVIRLADERLAELAKAAEEQAQENAPVV